MNIEDKVLELLSANNKTKAKKKIEKYYKKQYDKIKYNSDQEKKLMLLVETQLALSRLSKIYDHLEKERERERKPMYEGEFAFLNIEFESDYFKMLQYLSEKKQKLKQECQKWQEKDDKQLYVKTLGAVV